MSTDNENGQGSGTSDGEVGWPPRFGETFLGRSAIVLLVTFLLVVAVLIGAFVGSRPADTARSPRAAATFVLFALGALTLLAGVFFALAEMRKPPKVAATKQPETDFDAHRLEAQTLADTAAGAAALATKAADAFHGRKTSVVLFSIAFTLISLAASGAGLVSVSLDTTPTTPAPPAPSATATP